MMSEEEIEAYKSLNEEYAQYSIDLEALSNVEKFLNAFWDYSSGTLQAWRFNKLAVIINDAAHPLPLDEQCGVAIIKTLEQIATNRRLKFCQRWNRKKKYLSPLIVAYETE